MIDKLINVFFLFFFRCDFVLFAVRAILLTHSAQLTFCFPVQFACCRASPPPPINGEVHRHTMCTAVALVRLIENGYRVTK